MRKQLGRFVGEFGWQHVDVDPAHPLRWRQDQRPFHHVAQLADIAGPVIGLQRGERVFAEARCRHPTLGGKAREEMQDKIADILPPLRQGGQPDRHDIQPVV